MAQAPQGSVRPAAHAHRLRRGQPGVGARATTASTYPIHDVRSRSAAAATASPRGSCCGRRARVRLARARRGRRAGQAALPAARQHPALGARHFVVFESCDKKFVYIVDPAVGRRTIPLEEAAQVAERRGLVFEPGEDVRAPRSAARSDRCKRYRDWILGVRGIWSRILITSFFLQLLALAVPGLMGALVDKVVPRGDSALLYAGRGGAA